VIFGTGDHVVIRSAAKQIDVDALDVLVLGGLPIREHISHYGPFVMNTRREVQQAIDDFRGGRLGIIPADQLFPRKFA
jgi:quercetin 2,3-dioxygenase